MASAPEIATSAATLPASLKMVRSPRSWRRIAVTLILIAAALVAALVYIPWQQSVTGVGDIFVYDPMSRPQNVEAQISGRMVRWFVKDGSVVKQGDRIALITDIDPRYLDPALAANVKAQIDAQERRKTAALERIAAIDKQIVALQSSRKAQVPIATEQNVRADDLNEVQRNALESAKQAEVRLRTATIPELMNRIEQEKQRKDQAIQAVEQAKTEVLAAQLRYDRIKRLFEKPIPLRSAQDMELAERDLNVVKARKTAADQGVVVATQAISVAQNQLEGAHVEAKRLEIEVLRNEAQLKVTKRDQKIGDFTVVRVDADTTATIESQFAAKQAVVETVGTIDDTLAKLKIDLRNIQERRAQQYIVAPRGGQVTRLLKAGAGETVKQGDTICVLVPKTQDMAVEIYMSDNDAPLITPGRKVRLQFAGFPAVQFVGFPSVAVGTFGGEVRVIEAVDDGKSRFRVIVTPDYENIRNGKDQEWPPLTILRPGAQVTGWVMLDRVSLGFELWRQFNSFPPTVKRETGESAKIKPGGADEKAKEDKIKVKGPKLL